MVRPNDFNSAESCENLGAPKGPEVTAQRIVDHDRSRGAIFPYTQSEFVEVHRQLVGLSHSDCRVVPVGVDRGPRRPFLVDAVGEGR